MKKFIGVLILTFFITNPLLAKLKIVTSIFPLYSITKEIVGDRCEVVNILPPNVSPHIFEPRPSDVLKMRGADIFVYVGTEVEPWAVKLMRGAGGSPVIIEFASLVKPENNNYHFWLDPSMVLVLGKKITSVLVQKDPANKSYYLKRFSVLNKKLRELNELYRNRLSRVKNKNLIVFHNAWYYLAKRYRLNIVDVVIKGEGMQPTPRDMLKLAEGAKKYRIKVIFGEKLGNVKLLKKIAKNLGIGYILLDPLGCPDCRGRDNYFSFMKYNLNQLVSGLNR